MIKVQNNVASRTPIPSFLLGLKPESLLDLSWTDPALGVQDAAWWPEEDQSPQLGEFERYGDETLTPDAERKVVIVTREVESWSEEEIAEYEAQLQAEARRPITRLAFLSRFTDAEAVAIDLASIGTTIEAAMMRRYMAKVNAATFIDLDREDTRLGVLALESAGILAEGRALEILGSPVEPHEVPQ